MTSQFPDMTSPSKFFDSVLFLLSSLVTGPSFTSISSLVLELWKFSFIRDWPEIRKSEISASEFCPISGDWVELWIPNLVRMSLIEFYWMLQNCRVTAFTVFELLRENQLGGGNYPPPPRTQIRVNISFTNSTIRRASHFLNKLELLRDNIANRNPFVNISLAIFMQGQKINALVIKQLTKAKKLESFTSQSGF